MALKLKLTINRVLNFAEENKEVSKMEISLYDELSIFLQEQDPQQSQLVSHIIKKEIQLYQATKKRPENLTNFTDV